MKSILFNTLLTMMVLLSTSITEAKPVNFQYITSQDGISQSEIYTFMKDSRGFMWFGTLDGLNRYDGYKIDKFNTDRTTNNSLINNTIRSLAEDEHGRVWIGTDYGLNYYDPQADVICQIETSLVQGAIWSIYIEEDTLLVGMPSGLWWTKLPAKIDERTKLQVSQIHLVENESHENLFVKKILKSQQGGLWIVATGQVCRIVYNTDTGQYALTDIINHNILPTSFTGITSMIETDDGDLWIVSEVSGLLVYNISSQRISLFDNYGSISAPSSLKCSSIIKDNMGDIWIGTLDSGLNRVSANNLNKKSIRFEYINYQYTNPCSLNSNLIYSLYCTDNNQLWVGTIGSGINIYDANKKEFLHYRVDGTDESLVNSNFVRSITVDDNDNILFGTHANGLIKLDIVSNKYKKLGFDKWSIFHLLSTGGNNRYVVCSGVGLYLVEIIGDNMKILDHYFDESTFYAAKGEDDCYWIATLNGILQVALKCDKFEYINLYNEQSKPALSKNICRVIHYDKSLGKIYVGTEGGGLNILNLDKYHKVVSCDVVQQRGVKGDINSNYIRSITSDHNDNIWVGTYEGLNKLVYDEQGYKFTSYTTNDGLPNNMIQSIIEDVDKMLWIGTNGGLCRFDPKQEVFTNFSIYDGIQSNEFSEHTTFRKANGEIIMGGINGITLFNPKAIDNSTNVPNTTITRFFLSNKEVKVTGEKFNPLSQNIILTDRITLHPHQTNIGFEFSAMLYPNSYNVRYSYKLDGFDEEWHTADFRNRVVNYTNLSDGDYTLLVRSTNGDGVWEKSVKKIYIHIKTPLYRTRWAMLIYVLAILGLVAYIMRLYLARKRLLMLRNHAKKVHDLDKMRTRFFINISHDLRTPLTLIREPLRSLLDDSLLEAAVKNKLQLIMRNVKRLNYLVEQLLDTRKAEMGGLQAVMSNDDIVSFIKEELAHFNYAISQKGLVLNVIPSQDAIYVDFDRNMISKVIFNIISNALKYTDRGSITIKITRAVAKNGELKIRVDISDTGKGMSRELIQKAFDRFYQGARPHDKGYGIGLSHTKELIVAHQGDIEIESREGLGTTISFTIPDTTTSVEESQRRVSSYEDLYIEQDYVESATELRPDVKTILVVEDNADMRSFMKAEIGKYYNVITAKDGIDGFYKAVESKPDIIISDLLMPNLDGMELYERIKANVETNQTIFIFITAKDDIDTKYQGIEHGADEYLTKPFDMKYLLLRIENLLKSREQLRILYQAKSDFLLPSVNISSSDDKFIKQLFEQINNGLSNPDFTIASLESTMSMSHTNFYRKIKSLTGQSGQELLLSLRMKLAHKILSENKCVRVSEVAYMVGFSNPKYFSKRFKEIYGIAPNNLQK